MIDERPDISGLSVVSGLLSGHSVAHDCTMARSLPCCPLRPPRYLRQHASTEWIRADSVIGAGPVPCPDQRGCGYRHG